ncbi:MAG: flagellar biosynthesis repressor FlbT [Alphaproteobacteria bacterium]|nr:flagellar biosynthesis repressor FlbT [Alphaproteobacteria bacterium]
MALRITLESGRRIIVNGAVIENTGAPTTLTFHNKVNILRASEVLTEAEATTPARRLYHALQSAYLFEGNRTEYLNRFRRFVDDYLNAAPSAGDIAERTLKAVGKGDYYGALKSARKFLAHEDDRLSGGALSPESKE